MDSIARQIRAASIRRDAIITGKTTAVDAGTAAVRVHGASGYGAVPILSGQAVASGNAVVMVSSSNDPQDVRIIGVGGWAVP